MESVAEESLSNNLAMLAVKLNFSEKIFSNRVTKHILISPKISFSSISQVESKLPEKLKDSRSENDKISWFLESSTESNL